MFDINEGKALVFEDNKGRFTLSPRGCFMYALLDTKIINNCDDPWEYNDSPDFNGAFKVLVERYKENGWIEYDADNKAKGTKKDQKKVFVDTILGFYPTATKQQAAAACDLFLILLKEHGNTKPE